MKDLINLGLLYGVKYIIAFDCVVCFYLFVQFIWLRTLCGVFVVRPSVHRSVRPSIRPSIRLSTDPSVHPSVCPSIRLFIHPSIHPSVPSIRPSVHPSVCPCICLFVHLSADFKLSSDKTFEILWLNNYTTTNNSHGQEVTLGLANPCVHRFMKVRDARKEF